jgi:ribosomal protein L7/L12
MADALKKRQQFIVPPYPIDPQTNKIRLPGKIRQEVREQLKQQGKPAAIQQVMTLTGAGLRVSKDYVDKLEETAVNKRSKK